MGKGDEAGGDFHRRGSKKNRKQKTFQNWENKNEGGETPLLSALVRYSVTLSEGRARSEETRRYSNIGFNKTQGRHLIPDIRHGENQGLRILGSNEDN